MMLFKKTCLYLFLTCGAFQLLTCETCDIFETMSAHVNLTAQENSIVSLEVNVSTECMPGTVRLIVRPTAEDAKPGQQTIICNVNYENGSCTSRSVGNCLCDNDTKKYSIKLDFEDCQTMTLVLETSDNSMRVIVSAQYPSEIVNLTIENDGKAVTETSPAIMNTAVNISCQWKEGNPPDPPQLKRDGVVLSTNTPVKRGSLRHVSHVIHHVQCNDTGIISCGAAGASSNKSQMLHVKCEPLIADRKITFLASSKDKTLEFPVTAYHHHVVICQLQRYKATENVPNSLPSDCTSKASLTGSVPNLTLTIQLPEETSQMKGRWRLDLRNRNENGFVYFTIENNNPEPSRVLIGAVIVPIVVIVVVVIVVIVVWRQRLIHKGKTSRLPPPPALHTFRRRAPDAVMFHVQPAAQDHRDSFISVHDHIYSEIPDTSDESVQPLASSPVSEGSLSDDILRNIACPSSNSSLSDDDLAHPNVRSSSSVTTTATVHPAPKSDGMAAMTIAESWGEPSLDRNASMLPTSESTSGEDASHPRASCADELITATTVHTAGSGEEEAAAVAWTEPVYENNITASIPPCHALNDDYLQPIVSTLATERSDHPANMSTTTMSTAADVAPQRESTLEVSAPLSNNNLSDDYLHPIASVLEGATPATPARSDRPAQGSTASDVQPQEGNAVAKPQPHKNLLDDNFHPVGSALGKKTTAASEGEAVEPPYQNTMEMSLPLSHNTLPVDYLHPVAYTQEFATSIIGLSSSRLTTGCRADPPYENTTEMSQSLSDNTLTDDYLHPVASTPEAATLTTVVNSPCLVTPTNTDSTYKPPYENIEMSPSLSPD